MICESWWLIFRFAQNVLEQIWSSEQWPSNILRKEVLCTCNNLLKQKHVASVHWILHDLSAQKLVSKKQEKIAMSSMYRDDGASVDYLLTLIWARKKNAMIFHTFHTTFLPNHNSRISIIVTLIMIVKNGLTVKTNVTSFQILQITRGYKVRK